VGFIIIEPKDLSGSRRLTFDEIKSSELNRKIYRAATG
jgi:hypothetical protein